MDYRELIQKQTDVISLIDALPKKTHDMFVYKLNFGEKNDIITSLRPVYSKEVEQIDIASTTEFLASTKVLPTQLRDNLEKFRNDGNFIGAYFIRNLPVDEIAYSGYHKIGNLSELIFLTVASLIGTPFGYSGKSGGKVIQHLFPKKEDANKQLGSGSVELTWHTEDAHTELNCDFIGLLCLRGDPEAKTLVSRILPDEINSETKRELEKKEYFISADGSYNNKTKSKTAVLNYVDEQLFVKYDPMYTKCKSRLGEQALSNLTSYINSKSVSFCLEYGDLLLVDNRNSVHARSEYHPNFDGTDRWLEKAAIITKTVPHKNLDPQLSNMIKL